MAQRRRREIEEMIDSSDWEDEAPRKKNTSVRKERRDRKIQKERFDQED